MAAATQVKVLRPFLGRGEERKVDDILEIADFHPEGLKRALAEGLVEEVKPAKK